jgi:hypothetical protein
MQKGFASIFLISVVILILFAGAGGYVLLKNRAKAPVPVVETDFRYNAEDKTDAGKDVNFTEFPAVEGNNVIWNFDFNSKEWQVSGNPPACSDPLVSPAPADVTLASGILYPGQIRGGDYKPHGGLRFDNLPNNEVDVYAPMEGDLFRAAKYPEPESGEIQYFLNFINDCGIMYRLDHLRKLTPKFEEILNTIPIGTENDTRTTEIKPPVFVAKGEHIATKVGIENYPSGHEGRNIFFDFGVYDLRKTNGVNYDAKFRAQHPNIDEYGTHAICWFDYLEEEDKNIVMNLSAGGYEGETSDYCK